MIFLLRISYNSLGNILFHVFSNAGNVLDLVEIYLSSRESIKVLDKENIIAKELSGKTVYLSFEAMQSFIPPVDESIITDIFSLEIVLNEVLAKMKLLNPYNLHS